MAVLSIMKIDHPPSMNSYDERVISFSSWSGGIKKKKLLSFGFYYSGIDDIAVCHGCNLQLKKWKHTDIPLNEHIKFKHQCPLLPKGLFIQYGINYAILETVYPRYKNCNARIQSYNNFPVQCDRNEITEFAEAGFFYSGRSDWSFCFECGVGLKNWCKLENPWELHKRFYPHCKLVEKIPDRHEYRCTLAKTENVTLEEKLDYMESIDSAKRKSKSKKRKFTQDVFN